MKTFFAEKDNVLDKKVKASVDSMEFSSRTDVIELIKEVVEFFSEHFTDGDNKKAHNVLERHHDSVRRKDALLMAFFGALLAVFSLGALFLLCIPSSDGSYHFNRIFANLPVFRLIFAMVFVLMGAGFAIQIYKKFRVNYLFIFELDPNY